MEGHIFKRQWGCEKLQQKWKSPKKCRARGSLNTALMVTGANQLGESSKVLIGVKP